MNLLRVYPTLRWLHQRPKYCLKGCNNQQTQGHGWYKEVKNKGTEDPWFKDQLLLQFLSTYCLLIRVPNFAE